MKFLADPLFGIVPFNVGYEKISFRFGTDEPAVNIRRNIGVLPHSAIISELQFEHMARFIVANTP
nr:hypothetical protein [Mucilaginibacter rivuli]